MFLIISADHAYLIRGEASLDGFVSVSLVVGQHDDLYIEGLEMLLVPGSRDTDSSVVPVVARLVWLAVDVGGAVVLVAEDEEAFLAVLYDGPDAFVERVVEMADLLEDGLQDNNIGYVAIF